MTDPTTDPALASWVPVAPGSDFPIQNLPFGVFRHGEFTRVGVAIGEHVLDLAAVHAAGALDGLPAGIFARPDLNPFMALGGQVWRDTRSQISALLDAGSGRPGQADEWLVSMPEVEMELPVRIGDYVDFYSSIHHAMNVGRLFRPDAEPLLPNWRHLPVGYHGRASSVVVSGTPVVRPSGQSRGGDGPVFGPSQRLDIELEVGFVTGSGNALGTSIPVETAEEHIFGMCLVNDWSARDIQAWEYVPLGPFLGKSFATTMSPWIVTLDAVAPFRVPAPPQQPAPLPYLRAPEATGLDLHLSVELNGTQISGVNFNEMYWTMAQQLAHASVNGTNVRCGDLYASGTVSGTTPDALGSLLEMTHNGSEPLRLTSGDERTFLVDGDTVVLRGWCERDGAVRIGFGECVGTVIPARGRGGVQ